MTWALAPVIGMYVLIVGVKAYMLHSDLNKTIAELEGQTK